MVSGQFTEATAQPRLAALPMSHLSIEIGHLYLEDLLAGSAALVDHFRAAAPWARVAAESVGRSVAAGGRPRVSTCFLIDDYFSQPASPAEIIPTVLAAAEQAAVPIDYLARESACAELGDSRPAELLLARLVDEPSPGTTGTRPPTTETGWLCNGERSPSTERAAAMSQPRTWQPPRESAARGHSIFMDVELWRDDERRDWSCATLAATWQVLRLGLLRDSGRALTDPTDVDPAGPWPDRWAELPGILRLNRSAAPFAGYRAASVLAPGFFLVESAARTILSQFACDAALSADLIRRAEAEGLALPHEPVDRLQHIFY